MKTKIAFILIAGCMQTVSLFSQEYEYVPFPKSNAVWSEIEIRDEGHDSICYVYFRLEGGVPACIPAQEDYLLYDFSLVEGDYMPWCEILNYAQTSYRSYFGKEFTGWYTYYAMIDVATHSILTKVENRDTVLSNGISYKQAYTIYAGNNQQFNHYCFGIREDITTGSLFINTEGLNGFEGSEILVSRMDLQEGDKFYFLKDTGLYEFEGIQTDETGRYTVVDSVYNKDNRKHIRFKAHYARDYGIIDVPLIFIEGIGPNISFDPLIGQAWISVCFSCYETEDEIWKTDISNVSWPIYTEECLIEGAAIPEIKSKPPFELIQRKGEIEIQLDGAVFSSGAVNAYTLHGQLLYTKAFAGERNPIISTSGFPSGAYIIQVQDNIAKKYWGRKVIIIDN
jgi:hypothetical protein